MSDRFRIAIVGSGPAGLSAAARAGELGISYILLEKADHLADTVHKYHKCKHVMAAPDRMPLRSDMPFAAGGREAVLDTWSMAAKAKKLNIRLNAEVVAIEGTKGDFTIILKDGDQFRAETVILAIGTQGNLNILRCDGADLPHVQYQLDDPGEYFDEHIAVIGGGDAGIENAVALGADPEQCNVVTIVNRTAEFSRPKDQNTRLLQDAQRQGRLTVLTQATPVRIEPGWLTLDTYFGEERIRCDRVIARLGSAPPRRFVESCGIEFTAPRREAFPRLSSQFESIRPGIHVIGALAGNPLIKHAMNHGHDVVEFINGNLDLKPADEPILEAKFASLPGSRSVEESLEFLRSHVRIFHELSPLQMREFMLDSSVSFQTAGATIFARNDFGNSLFAVASGSVLVQENRFDPSFTVPIAAGSIFGETGLAGGRPRGISSRAAEDTILVEIPRLAALKLMAAVPPARHTVVSSAVQPQLIKLLGANLASEELAELLETAVVKTVKAGEAIITEGDVDRDLFIVLDGSMMVEKMKQGGPVYLASLPAGTWVGARASIEGSRHSVTIRAVEKSEVVRIDGDAFAHLLARKPELVVKLRRDGRADKNTFIEAKKESFGGVIDMYSSVAGDLIDEGIDEAEDIPSSEHGTTYRVGFATNRAPIDSCDISRGFSGERGGETRYGTCDVFIPKSHTIGSVGSSFLRRLLARTDDRLRLRRIHELTREGLLRSLDARLAKARAPNRHAVVFIHGYNVSFEDAALRAAQIGIDLAIPAMAFFSWPSKGRFDGYPADCASIEASEKAISDFLVELAKRTKADAVHVIAHSMGNRGLLRAVTRIAADAEQRAGIHFGQFILAAPDVDADTFRQLAEAYSRLANRTTLYVSGRDRAVGISEWLHEYPRIGYVPPVTTFDGIDTVNVTNVDLTILGHSYVAEARDVLNDMHQLIFQDLPPDQRFAVRKAITPTGETYWVVGA